MPRARDWVARDLAPSAKAALGTDAAATTAAVEPKRVLIACDRDMGSLDIANEVEEEELLPQASKKKWGRGRGANIDEEGALGRARRLCGLMSANMNTPMFVVDMRALSFQMKQG